MFSRIPGQDNTYCCEAAGDGLGPEKEFPQSYKIHNMTQAGYQTGIPRPGQQSHLFMGTILISKTSTSPLSVVLFVVAPRQVLIVLASLEDPVTHPPC